MVLPLRVMPVDGWVDPADAFVALHAPGDAVWLDAGPDASEGRTFIASGSTTMTSSVADGTVTVGGDVRPGGILDALRTDLLQRGRSDTAGFPIGWIGWLGYEAGVAALGLPHAAAPGPDAALLFADRLVVFDHEARRVQLVVADAPDADEWLTAAASALHDAHGTAQRYAADHPVHPAAGQWRHDDAEYLRMIESCQDAIRAGDAYQLCLTNRAEAATDADPLAVHLRLRAMSPAHHSGYVRIGSDTLVSSSPEQFLQVGSDGRVRTKPIKGTRPRGTTVARDVQLRAELEASEKERAENVMIVDLMRNDLGRVCEIGSVEVRHLLAVESYAQVHQLVSTVEGRLRPGLDAVDAVAAAFPAGSMTGAPKLSAIRILGELERGPRGVYSGCFGYLGVDGSADLAMVIRSIHLREGRVAIGAGGGITALSVPAEELDEVRIKAAALFRAAGIAPIGNGPSASNV